MAPAVLWRWFGLFHRGLRSFFGDIHSDSEGGATTWPITVGCKFPSMCSDQSFRYCQAKSKAAGLSFRRDGALLKCIE